MYASNLLIIYLCSYGQDQNANTIGHSSVSSSICAVCNVDNHNSKSVNIQVKKNSNCPCGHFWYYIINSIDACSVRETCLIIIHFQVIGRTNEKQSPAQKVSSKKNGHVWRNDSSYFAQGNEREKKNNGKKLSSHSCFIIECSRFYLPMCRCIPWTNYNYSQQTSGHDRT